MKVCTKCGVEKPESEFFYQSRAKMQRHAECKPCYKEYRKTYYKQHYAKYHEHYLARAKLRHQQRRLEYRQNLIAYMADKACLHCGESDIRVLEFDHLDSSLKTFSISQGVAQGHSWQDIEEEIKKCQILCANCHKKRTAKQFNWYKAL